MNCPDCRRKLMYWPEFSDPQKGQWVGSCDNCMALYMMLPQKLTPKALVPYRGYRILKTKLAKFNYTPPLLHRRAPTKEG